MTDKQNELLPCAHCGKNTAREIAEYTETPSIYGVEVSYRYSVTCGTDGCRMTTGTFATKSEARAAWNRRVEQIAVKVICETEDENGVPLEHENYFCPGCKTLIYQRPKKWIEPVEWQNYCIDCGQRMDWSDFINPPLPGKEGN